MSTQVKKAVITAAGMGTRFLPQTKSMPKEMLPLNNKPIIQHIVENLVKAGVDQIIIVTGYHKRTIENHFDRSFELEIKLEAAGKLKEKKAIVDVARAAEFVYVRQKDDGYGNALPLLAARSVIGDEPFFVVFPDDFYITCEKPNEYQQMLKVYEKYAAPVMSLFEVAKEDIPNYGIIKPKPGSGRGKIIEVAGLVEKPAIDKAPSNLAGAGTYILNNDIWPYIDMKLKDNNGEHNLPVTLGRYAKDKRVLGKIIEGDYHDTGSPKLYLKAVIEMALEDKELSPYIKKHIQKLIKEGRI